jgi:hypothetical protein
MLRVERLRMRQRVLWRVVAVALLPAFLAACGETAACSKPQKGPHISMTIHGLNAPTLVKTPTSNWGTVRFGRYVDPDFHIIHPTSTFNIHQKVSFVAYFDRDVKGMKLTMEVLKVVCDHEDSLYSTDDSMPPRSVGEESLVLDPAARVWDGIADPGTYIVRYSRGKEILAQGQYTIVDVKDDGKGP